MPIHRPPGSTPDCGYSAWREVCQDGGTWDNTLGTHRHHGMSLAFNRAAAGEPPRATLKFDDIAIGCASPGTAVADKVSSLHFDTLGA